MGIRLPVVVSYSSQGISVVWFSRSGTVTYVKQLCSRVLNLVWVISCCRICVGDP